MRNFDNMTLEQLTTHRADLVRQIDELRAEYRAAGLVLERKRQETPEALAQRKIDEGRAELAALRARAEVGNG